MYGCDPWGSPSRLMPSTPPPTTTAAAISRTWIELPFLLLAPSVRPSRAGYSAPASRRKRSMLIWATSLSVARSSSGPTMPSSSPPSLPVLSPHR
ncbi:hypothetical protein SLEP1_g45424 [Rubroshorea leprosula]|uniref:Uncharacterized protein n=1 Tax=Rubroshorea leprosula TaxID=152421 RepID=A0AAV5LJC8_9ROSI|nr:hypothetical protein SLEP1_g45424 [Rubroshorea leprosula]